MDILIDENVLNFREGGYVIPEPLQHLERILEKAGHTLTVHPYSVKGSKEDEIEGDFQSVKSLIDVHSKMNNLPVPNDNPVFCNKMEAIATIHDKVEYTLLYAVYANEVDFLIAGEQEVYNKSLNIGIQDRIFTTEGRRGFFTKGPQQMNEPIPIQKTTLGELDLDDPIFDSLKEQYGEFSNWAESNADRPAWVNYCDNKHLGAILILKFNEKEDIGDNPSLGVQSRLKICTLKVAESLRGSNVGEYLILIAIRAAINHELDQLYLTHYIQEEDYLVKLVKRYGFKHMSDCENGEAIFQKRIIPDTDGGHDFVEIGKTFIQFI